MSRSNRRQQSSAVSQNSNNAAVDPAKFPAPSVPEIAFAGRSNVGKSSLLNALAGGKLAHVSSTPGRTRTIHIKEHGDKTFESAFYKEVFQLCETTSGTKWYIVEMGGAEGNGFDVPRAALEKLHRLGK